MSRANTTSPIKRQADDGLDIPEFLKISAERRKQAWLKFDARHSSKPAPAFGRDLTETERAYRASIAREKGHVGGRARACLAADVIDGKVALVGLTVRSIATLARLHGLQCLSCEEEIDHATTTSSSNHA
jgi:hypothetical protein